MTRHCLFVKHIVCVHLDIEQDELEIENKE